MPKYLAQVNYVGEGIKGLLKEGGSSRRAAIEKLFGPVGAKIEALYYAFGDIDLFIILDAPDNVTAAALPLVVNATGAAAVKYLKQLLVDIPAYDGIGNLSSS